MDEKDRIIGEQARVIAEQTRVIAEQARIIMELRGTIARLEARIAELERQLGKNSTNSSKPPSSDGLKRPNRLESTRESIKSFGGQKGHKGNTLETVENPDRIEMYKVKNCKKCRQDLSGQSVEKIIKRQEFGIVALREIIEHQAEVKKCGCCGHVNIGTFPKHIKSHVQYSEGVKSLSVYLMSNFIPLKRQSQLFEDIFKMRISETSLMGFTRECAGKLGNIYKSIKNYLENCPVKNADETGFRINGKTNWLHVLCNDMATHYRPDEKRSNLPNGLSGTVVHDGLKGYFNLEGIEHALCNAHHLRELKALIEYEKEPWANGMSKLLKHISQLDKPTKKLINRMNILYDRIIEEGLEYHTGLASPSPKPKRGRQKKREGHNLLLRLKTHKQAVLKSMTDPTVPFTNNQAERDLRMMKVQQKVSGSFRQPKGAQYFSVIMSFLSTLQKQGVNKLTGLKAAFHSRIYSFKQIADLQLSTI